MPDRKLTIAAAIATILTSLALYPIFSGSLWFWSSVLAVIVVAGAGTLTRMRRLPPLVCLAGGFAGLLLYLNVRFEAVHSLLLIIPTPGSLSGLWDLAAQGLDAVNSYAPPVPDTPSMMLLVCAGVGVAAILVDTIAVRLHSAAVAGLPLLMLFTEPFAVSVARSGIGTAIVFCVAAAGYLMLLSADGRQRIHDWGRIAGADTFRPDTTALASAGRRVGLASVVMALFIPLLVPGLHATRLFAGTFTFGSGNGDSSVTLPSPVTQLNKELTESRQAVLRYTTTSPDPATQYLQEYVLSDLTDAGWTWSTGARSVPVNPRLPASVGLNRSTTTTNVSTTITFSPDVSSSSTLTFLPMPYPSGLLSAAGSWSADPQSLMVFGKDVNLAGFSYTVKSLDLEPSSTELEDAAAPPASITGQYATVPAGYRALDPLAERITRGDKTELAKALALQTYLSSSGGFTYTLNASAVTSPASLAVFLESTKRGYCEQFAYAMTVLARLLHIPARYAIGYTAGERQSNGTWLVRTSDAHAWPELYFSGVGWIRFEPTPAGSGGQGTATSPSYAILPAVPGGTSTSPATSPTSPATAPASSTAAGSARAHLHNLADGADGGTGAGSTGQPSAGTPWISWVLLAVLVLAVLVLVLPGLARITARWLRWRSAAAGDASGGDAGGRDASGRDASGGAAMADAAWRQFRADLADYHVAVRPSESPRALATRVAAELAVPVDAAEAIRRIGMAAERARYSAAPGPAEGLRTDTAVSRRAIGASMSRRVRIQARLLPMSVLAPAATRLDRFARRTRSPRLPRLPRRPPRAA